MLADDRSGLTKESEKLPLLSFPPKPHLSLERVFDLRSQLSGGVGVDPGEGRKNGHYLRVLLVVSLFPMTSQQDAGVRYEGRANERIVERVDRRIPWEGERAILDEDLTESRREARPSVRCESLHDAPAFSCVCHSTEALRESCWLLMLSRIAILVLMVHSSCLVTD